MLLSREAIAAAADVRLNASDFYKPAHGHSSTRSRASYGAGEPVDPVTVADELRRADLLDAVGGPAPLVDLQAAHAGHLERRRTTPASSGARACCAGSSASPARSPRSATPPRRRHQGRRPRRGDGLRRRPAARDRLHQAHQATCSTTASTGSSSSTTGATSITGSPPATTTSTSCSAACSRRRSTSSAPGPRWANASPGTRRWSTRPPASRHRRRAAPARHRRRRSQFVSARRRAPAHGRRPSRRSSTTASSRCTGSAPGSGARCARPPAHPFLTPDRLAAARDLTIGARVAVPRELPVFGDEPVLGQRAPHGRPRARSIAGLVAPSVRPPDAAFRRCRCRSDRRCAGAPRTATTAAPGPRWRVQHAVARGRQRPAAPAAALRRQRPSPPPPAPRHGPTIRHPELRTFAERIGLAGRDDELHRVVRAAGKRHRTAARVDTVPPRALGRASVPPAAGGAAPSRRRPSPRPRGAADSSAVYDDTRLAISTPSAILWDEVVGIEPDGMDQVYDLTVPGEHNFVAADVFVHNTAFAPRHGDARRRRGAAPGAVLLAGDGPPRAHPAPPVERGAGRLARSCAPASSASRTGRRSATPSAASPRPRSTSTTTPTRPSWRSGPRRGGSRRSIGDLGLVVIDYLQLMTGRSAAENRQVEVSEISRGLKILARELEARSSPSASSPQLELPADKRPMLADLREVRLPRRATRLTRADTNEEVTLGELVQLAPRTCRCGRSTSATAWWPARCCVRFPAAQGDVPAAARIGPGRRGDRQPPVPHRRGLAPPGRAEHR